MGAVPVLHIDEHLLVVDKPAGLLVVGAPRRTGPTLIELVGRQIGGKAIAVHRLDEDTTGAMLIARDDEARASLEEMFRRHDVWREYLALVAGGPSPVAGRIESRLAEVDGVMRVVERGGLSAVTEYETLERRGRHTLVRCRLETGRRNQIRVHLAALGCPLAGDRKYGYRPRPGDRFSRPMLHSWRLRFDHPLLATRIECEVSPPEPELRP